MLIRAPYEKLETMDPFQYKLLLYHTYTCLNKVTKDMEKRAASSIKINSIQSMMS
jgi:hypothetical protein